MIIESIFMKYDKPNMNGRIYPKEVMEKAIREYLSKDKIILRNNRLKKLEKINKML